MAPSLGRRLAGRVRGQASVIGLILVFGMVLAGSVAVVVLGTGAIDDSQERLSEQRAENAMTQFDSEVALVALGAGDVQQVSFGANRGANYEVQNDTGWLRVTVENRTAGNTTVLLNESLGAVTYEGRDTTLAYQGGGVWRTTGGTESVMVSPPEFHFRNGTLTLPVVTTTGQGTLGSTASIRHEETVSKYPNASAGDVNPLTNHEVVLSVKSEYYKGWGRYFEERTDGEVAYDHDRKVANLTLKSPAGLRTVTRAIAATADSGDFSIEGTGSKTDSYNSSVGPYGSGGSSGNITVGGDFTISGNAEVDGNVRAGGEFDCDSNAAEVTGTVFWVDGFDPKGGDCPAGGDEQINDIAGDSSVTSYVDDTVETIRGDNDNASADVSGGSLDFGGGSTATLTPGDYYLEDLTVAGGDTLELQTNGDEIRIAVDEYVSIEDDSTIEIQGDGHVRIFVRGTDTVSGHHFQMVNSGNDTPEVTTPGSAENSTQLWVYGNDDMVASIQGSGSGQSSKFVGVVYAPAGDTGTSEVEIDAGEVYGGIIAGDASVSQGGAVHFDEALREERALPPNTKVVKVTYLHVTVSRVRVS